MSEYLAPTSLDEALLILEQFRERSVIMAGGTDLTILIKESKIRPDMIVDVSGIQNLKGISLLGNRIVMGAATTYRDVIDYSVGNRLPQVLSEAANLVGSPQVRNIGTIGGNLGTASPAGDFCAALLSVDAVAHIRSRTSTRTVPLSDFFIGPRKTVLKPGELVTEVSFPVPVRSGYRKLGLRSAMAISLVSVAASVFQSADGSYNWRIALGSVAPIPVRATEAELLMGQGRELKEVAHAVKQNIKPITDPRASAEYRTEMAGHLTFETLKGLAI